RTDPPPSKRPDPPSSGSPGRPSQIPRPSRVPLQLDEAAAQREREKDVIEDLDITVGETEISLSDVEQLGESQIASAWTDPEPSEHDRVTVPPPMPEQEYVAKMMKELPEAERVPPSRAITPTRGLSKPPLGADSAAPTRKSRRPSARPKKKDQAGPSTKPRPRASRAPAPEPAPTQNEPLTLDLSDSLLPVAVPAPVPLPHFEKSVVPKFDTIDSGPAPAPRRPRATLPSTAQNSALDVVAA